MTTHEGAQGRRKILTKLVFVRPAHARPRRQISQLVILKDADERCRGSRGVRGSMLALLGYQGRTVSGLFEEWDVDWPTGTGRVLALQRFEPWGY